LPHHRIIEKVTKAFENNLDSYIKVEATKLQKGGLTAWEITGNKGGGATIKKEGTKETLSLVTINHRDYIRHVTIFHEFFGHGRSLNSGRTKAFQHQDAVKLENLVWRVLGSPEKQIKGRTHNKFIGDLPDYKSLPNFE